MAALFLVVPRTGTKGFARMLAPDTFSKAAVEMDTIPEGHGSEAYCIVFDAGSTGTFTWCSAASAAASSMLAEYEGVADGNNLVTAMPSHCANALCLPRSALPGAVLQ